MVANSIEIKRQPAKLQGVPDPGSRNPCLTGSIKRGVTRCLFYTKRLVYVVQNHINTCTYIYIFTSHTHH